MTIAASALLFGALLLTSRAMALRWFAAVATCGVVTAAGKLALYWLGTPVEPFGLGSPSGHVAASVLVYGVLPLAAAQPRRTWWVLAAAIIAAIAASRIYLQAHSVSDVVVGAGIGGACLLWFMLPPAPRPGLPGLRLAAAPTILLCTAGALLGWRLHLDRVLHAIAGLLPS